jgi:hypothetical protein
LCDSLLVECFIECGYGVSDSSVALRMASHVNGYWHIGYGYALWCCVAYYVMHGRNWYLLESKISVQYVGCVFCVNALELSCNDWLTCIDGERGGVVVV